MLGSEGSGSYLDHVGGGQLYDMAPWGLVGLAALTPDSRLLGGVCGLLCPRPLPCLQQELLVEVVVDTALTKAKGLCGGLDWREPLERRALRSTVGTGP